MAMRLSIVFGLGCVLFSFISVVDGLPELSAFSKVVLLSETVRTNAVLSIIDCLDTANLSVTSQVISVDPMSPCGNCFNIFQHKTGFQLEYRAGIDTLSHSAAPSYLMSVSCSNTVDTPLVEVMEVRIVPNSPPYFNASGRNVSMSVSSSTPAGSVLYLVQAVDDEGEDIIYSMSVIPVTSSSHYQIDKYTGKITTKVDLRSECRGDVTMVVTISDGHSSVGPLVLSVIVTATAFNILASGQLDYEVVSQRVTDFIIQLTDGYCVSPVYTLTLQVTDVNEAPEITPTEVHLQLCEGKVEFNPGLRITDDYSDQHLWSISNATQDESGHFGIDQDTGLLRTLLDYDVDSGLMVSDRTIVVQVTDKGGLTATAIVNVTFVDCNDNAPVFESPFYTAAATECTPPGSNVVTVHAYDNDTSHQQNNVIHYSGTGGSVYVNASGHVIVAQPMPAGTVVTFLVYAYDRGQTPGPLKSINPTVVSVRFTPCPPIRTTTTTTTQQPIITTAALTTEVVPKKNDNTAWIVLAALLGTFFLGLLGYMLWRYGGRCLRAFSEVSCDNSWCNPKLRTRVVKIKSQTPAVVESMLPKRRLQISTRQKATSYPRRYGGTLSAHHRPRRGARQRTGSGSRRKAQKTLSGHVTALTSMTSLPLYSVFSPPTYRIRKSS
ncbi:protocadherin-11 X-linked-like isoform X3 [Biomphalaria glabrata]|uniref:Protocadherin-11 X-linked-like isoform X3 n=1 Tax=Biomphalaria glabrata TaxID=6526 RepID=A0A9W2ZBS1_BIOGL|nr:protocadherin-11 X-linked-like isoform X3 [Biomphalaria glabrata]